MISNDRIKELFIIADKLQQINYVDQNAQEIYMKCIKEKAYISFYNKKNDILELFNLDGIYYKKFYNISNAYEVVLFIEKLIEMHDVYSLKRNLYSKIIKYFEKWVNANKELNEIEKIKTIIKTQKIATEDSEKIDEYNFKYDDYLKLIR